MGMQVYIFTDGAVSCVDGEGPGGWAAWLVAVRDNGEIVSRLISGYCGEITTIGRMELMPVVMGLEALTRPTTVTIVSDSQYVVQSGDKWLAGWVKGGWVKSDKKPVKHQDLWERVLAQMEKHTVHWMHVGGHQADAADFFVEWNNRADASAVEMRDRAKRFLETGDPWPESEVEHAQQV